MTHPSHELSKIFAIRRMEPEMIGLVVGDWLRVNLPKIVDKGLEHAFKCSESRRFELRFLDKISTPVLTGQKIKGEGCASIRVALYDCQAGTVVKSGREANAKIKLVVLKGDSDGDGVDNLTVEGFKRKIVKEIKGKKSFLKGKTMLKLKNGCCDIGEISFVHRSGWVKICQLSLAARVVDNFPGTTIQPAMTEYFMLKDRRNTLYKKHHPPCLSDEVWRLDKISKDGAFHKRLSVENVNIVKDFLTLLFLDPAKLRDILGTKMSAKMWEVTVDHARTCELGRTVHLYQHTAEKKTAVVFNVVGQVMGMILECQYVASERLSETELAEAQRLVILAFKQWEKVTSYDDETSLVDGISLLSDVYHPANSSAMAESSNVIDISSLDRISFDYPQLNASTSNIMPYSIGGSSNVDDYGIHSRLDQSMIFPNQATESLISDPEPFTPALYDEHIQYLETDFSLQNASLGSQSDQHGMVDGFIYAHSAATVAIVKARRRWITLFSVLRWFSISRIVVRKSM